MAVFPAIYYLHKQGSPDCLDSLLVFLRNISGIPFIKFQFLHLLKAFPLEGSAGYAVVYKELRVPIAFPTGEVL